MNLFLSSMLSFVFFLSSCSELPQQEGETHSEILSDEIDILMSSSMHPDKSFSSRWSVTRTLLEGGRQEGVELLTLNNGKLKIVVIPTRGMGILEVNMKELRLGWDSPVK